MGNYARQNVYKRQDGQNTLKKYLTDHHHVKQWTQLGQKLSRCRYHSANNTRNGNPSNKMSLKWKKTPGLDNFNTELFKAHPLTLELILLCLLSE